MTAPLLGPLTQRISFKIKWRVEVIGKMLGAVVVLVASAGFSCEWHSGIPWEITPLLKTNRRVSRLHRGKVRARFACGHDIAPYVLVGFSPT